MSIEDFLLILDISKIFLSILKSPNIPINNNPNTSNIVVILLKLILIL